MKKILQIIPTPPNHSDGIGDYALQLATQLQQDFQVDTQFLVFRNDLQVEPIASGFTMQQLSLHTTEQFCAAIPSDIQSIIVHFSAYPYFNTSLKGSLGVDTPFWLIEALRSVVTSQQLKLVVMFHELPKLYWRQFYVFDFLNPIQCIVSRRLARMADTILTSSTRFQSILSNWIGKDVPKILIFSSMGEPESIVPLSSRQRRLIIFGGSARARIYDNHSPALIQSCQLLGINEIYDIGSTLKLPNYSPAGIELRSIGFRSPAEISELLSTSLAGCIDYSPFPGNLGKSSVFAAYCAHGLVPILTRYNPSEVDDLYNDRHYLAFGSELAILNLDRLQIVADTAHQWYRRHTTQAIAKTFFSYL
jgi:hypothetical protein